MLGERFSAYLGNRCQELILEVSCSFIFLNYGINLYSFIACSINGIKQYNARI